MTETPNLYALLIGIDYYKPNRLYKSLKGAVRDINLVDTYLQTAVTPKQTWKLVSPNPDVVDAAEVAAAQDYLPTYDNIVKAFQEITETAQAGELVYIHYSGHGGRATTIYADLKGEGQNDEGIVPIDIGDQEGRYLRDVEIATLLKRMTDKGLLVTVILDSCHSGGATRGDAEIRSSELGTDTTERSLESSVATREELVNNWQTLTEKSEIRVAGLPEARDYVLLAACRPNEYAYEYAVEGQDRHGALTYWLINTLTSSASSGQRLTYKLLHDRINAQIQSKFPSQLPMILGESDRLVFGRDRWSTPYTVSVMTVNSAKAQVTLNAGMAQGLSRGTRFAIYPLHTTDFTDKQKQVAIVEVTQVEAAGATARFVKPEEGGIAVTEAIEPGSPAVMIAAPVELIRRVQLLDQKPQGDQEHELPSEWVDRQQEAIEAVRQALAGNGWVVEVQSDEQASHYQVAVGRNGEYEISIETPLTNLRPALMIDNPQAAESVVKRLIHLAKYQAVQSLDNAGSKLTDVLDVQLLTAEEKPFPDTQTPTIHAGEVVCLRIVNRGNQPLKIAVLDLEPTWEISQLKIDGFDAPFYPLESGQTKNIGLRLLLPEESEYEETTERLRIFAIQKGLADFRWLMLPSLDHPLETRGASLNAALQGMTDQLPASRGEAEEINPLNELLATIGADLEDAPATPKKASPVLDPTQDWMTKQIQVVVKQ